MNCVLSSHDKLGKWLSANGWLVLPLMTVLMTTDPLAVAGDEANAAATPPPLSPSQLPPNIVVIMTDDQHAESLRVMPNTLKLIADQGVTFQRFFTTYALCAPSRATFLTGQYPHNHGVLYNIPPAGGYAKLDHANTLPVWLQKAGYYTIHIGKYLNGYGEVNPLAVPPGWDSWQGLVDPTTYGMYNYTINDNGLLVVYGEAEADYQTDVLAGRAVAAIHARARASKSQPFFLSIAPIATHETYRINGWAGPGPQPAPRHLGRFGTKPLPQPPSFDEADVSDKPSFIQKLPRLTAADKQQITRRYHARLESLLAVDELVRRVVEALGKTGQLADTVIFFTSDNGFFQGEHRLRQGKNKVYEEASRVPLLIRGRGFPAGTEIGWIAANIDLAPTIVELAQATPARELDGRSLLSLVSSSTPPSNNRALLFEASTKTGEPRYQAVRTWRYLYAEHYLPKKEFELYDMALDPFQLNSQHLNPGYAMQLEKLRNRLNQLHDCSGAGCCDGC